MSVLSVLSIIAVILWYLRKPAGRHTRLTRWMPGDSLTLLVFGLPFIMGLCAYIVLAMGLAGIFQPLAVRITMWAALWVFLWFLMMDVYGRMERRRAPGGGRARTAWIAGLLLIFVAAMAFFTLTGALAPATSNEWDALAYHLAVPKVWLESGRIHPIPYDHHSNFPFLTEMLFLSGLAEGSVPLAKSYHWLYGMLGALACYWAGREWVSRTAGFLAAALFLAAPIVVWEATTAYIDLASTVYVALSVFAFIKWMEARSGTDVPASGAAAAADRPADGTPDVPHPGTSVPGTDGWLYLAGIMAGFAAGTKMTMVATSGLLVLWAVGCVLLRRPHFAQWKHAGIVAGLALLIGGPWYVKTWLWTGNPVYPFAYNILGGNWWSAQAAVDYAAEQARFGIGKSAWALWVAPWTTVFFSQYYANPPATYAGALQDAQGPSLFPAVFGTLGLGAIAFVPLWLLAPGLGRAGDARKGNGALTAMVLYSGAFLVVWFGLTHQTRYLMVLLPLLLVPGAAGVRAFWRAGAGWRFATGAVAAVALLWGIVPAWVLAQPAFAVVWGDQSADEYLSEREPIYVASKRVNDKLPKDAKVLMLQEVRGFYIDRAYQWGNPEQNALIAWDSFRSPEEMDRALREQGITHVLVNWGLLDPNANRPKWAQLAEQAIAGGSWRPVITTVNDPMRGITVYEIAGS